MDRGAWQAGYSPWVHKESDTTRPLTALSNTYKQKKPIATRISEPQILPFLPIGVTQMTFTHENARMFFKKVVARRE